MKWYVAGLMVSISACMGCHREVALDRSNSNRPLTLIVSGDTAGWIVPCGCTSNQSGGLPRRGALIRGLERSRNLVVLDAGGAAGGSSAYQQLKLKSILTGEQKMGIDAHNIGQVEAEFGIEFLKEVVASGFPLISTNLSTPDGSPLAERAKLVTRSGDRLLITGVLAPSLTPEFLKAADPQDAILEVAAAHEGEFDHLVVLAYLPEEELTELAQNLPEADLVVGGPTGQAISPQKIGPVLLASATNKGKFVVRFDRLKTKEEESWTGSIVELNESYADEKEQAANVRDYLLALGERAFRADETGLTPPMSQSQPASFRTAGSESCQTCHAKDQAIWQTSKHHHSWETLVERGYQVDPGCQKCHVTNYGLPGGFVSARESDRHLHVGCESCHGPSQAHVDNPRIRTPFLAADQCIRCHDKENSPAFNYATYWSKIQHGTEKPVLGGSK